MLSNALVFSRLILRQICSQVVILQSNGVPNINVSASKLIFVLNIWKSFAKCMRALI